MSAGHDGDEEERMTQMVISNNRGSSVLTALIGPSSVFLVLLGRGVHYKVMALEEIFKKGFP